MFHFAANARALSPSTSQQAARATPRMALKLRAWFAAMFPVPMIASVIMPAL
jgi:hypothetical protein